MEDYNELLRKELRDIQKDITALTIQFARAEEQLSSIKRDVEDVKSEIQNFKTEIHNDFVSNESFSPVKNFVYGTIALIATGFLGAVFALINWGGK